MKCPKCQKEGCTYEDQHKKEKGSGIGKTVKKTRPQRENYCAKCKKCGWEGMI